MSEKKKRKLRVFLNSNSHLYRFCWLEFLVNGSLSFGLNSQSLEFSELGQAVYCDGEIISHNPFSNGNRIDAKSLHLTFHPPSKYHSSGVAHFVHSQGKVKEWPLTWFPVKSPRLLVSVNVPNVDLMKITASPKGQYHVVQIPKHLSGFEMRVIVLPSSTRLQRDESCSAFDVVGGYCPHYLAVAEFYESSSDLAAIYVAMDQKHNKYLKRDGLKAAP